MLFVCIFVNTFPWRRSVFLGKDMSACVRPSSTTFQEGVCDKSCEGGDGKETCEGVHSVSVIAIL